MKAQTILTKEEYERISKLAKEEKRSLSNYIRKAILLHLKNG